MDTDAGEVKDRPELGAAVQAGAGGLVVLAIPFFGALVTLIIRLILRLTTAPPSAPGDASGGQIAVDPPQMGST